MRPQSIVRFEQAYLGSVVLWLVNIGVRWKAMLASLEDQRAFAGNAQMMDLINTFLIGSVVFLLVLWLLLWYFTARRASEVAKWVVVVLFGLSAISLPFNLASYNIVGMPSTLLSVAVFALNAWAVWLLFRPDARSWFAGGTAQADTAPFE